MELSWSRWFRYESSFGLMQVPDLPGIFALAEEVAQPGGPDSRRMLAVFEVSEADHLLQDLSRIFAADSPWHEHLKNSACYLRYVVVADPERRRAATEALRNWLSSQMSAAAQIFEQVRVPAIPREAATVAERAVDRVMAAKPLVHAQA